MTLFEVTLATALLGLVVAGALKGTATARRIHVEHDAAARGILLAQEFLAEATSQAYADPQAPTAPLGLDAGEQVSDRGSLDDVDDYDGLGPAAPVDRQGAAMIDYDGWKVGIQVHWVEPEQPNVVASGETGLKRVRVKVVSPSGAVTWLDGLRSQFGAADQLQPIAGETLTSLAGELTVGGSPGAQRTAVPLANQAPPAP